jgi:hypothetical protein
LNGDHALRSERFEKSDFELGFAIGYQLARGLNAEIPAAPDAPAISENLYLDGIRSGLRAGGMSIMPIFDFNPSPIQTERW